MEEKYGAAERKYLALVMCIVEAIQMLFNVIWPYGYKSVT
jgi:hypothetical protein